MSRRRTAAWITVALCAVALVVGIGHRVAPLRGGTVSTPAREREINIAAPSSAPSSARTTAEVQPKQRLPDEPVEKRFPLPTTSTELPTSEISDAKAEEMRQWYWQRLRTFAVEADLTESEWQRLLGDISDLASPEIEAHTTALEEHASTEEASRFTGELAKELDERCASWMTTRQLQIYDYRGDSDILLSMTRRLRILESLGKVSTARL